MDKLARRSAVFAQRSANVRHLWAQQAMDEAEYYLHTPNVGPCVIDFIWSSNERAIYAEAAMTWMGITEEDQYYA